MTDDTSAPGSGFDSACWLMRDQEFVNRTDPARGQRGHYHLTVFSDDPLQAPGHRAGRLGSKPGEGEAGRDGLSRGGFRRVPGGSPVPALPRILP